MMLLRTPRTNGSPAGESGAKHTGQLVTTDFALVVVADGCAGTAHRREMAVQIVRELRENPNVVIVPCSGSFLPTIYNCLRTVETKSGLSPTVRPFCDDSPRGITGC